MKTQIFDMHAAPSARLEALKFLSADMDSTEPSDAYVNNHIPVSYTHLDVYKRQHQCRGL